KGSRKKHVAVRRPDPDRPGEWIWDMRGVRRVVYGLHELAEQKMIFFPEGEQCSDDVKALGLVATTSPGGTGGWRSAFAGQVAAVKPELVVVLPDNDPAGILLAQKKAAALYSLGVPVKVLPLSDVLAGGDISDWIANRGTRERLLELVDATPVWTPAEASELVGGAPEVEELRIPQRPSFAIVTPTESFITKYVQMAQMRTDAPAEAHELTAAGVLSALAGPRPRIPLAHTSNGVRLNLWTMNIAESTDARKTTTLNLGLDVLTSVLGAEAILPWEGSPQAFIQQLADRDGGTSVFARDEYSGLLLQIGRGGHMAGLAQTFIRAFDGLPIENTRTRKRVMKRKDEHDDANSGALDKVDDTDRAKGPC